MDVKLALGPATGAAPTIEIADFESFTYSSNVDEGASIQAIVSGTSDASRVLAELSTDLWLYINGVLEQRFRILDVSETYLPDGGFNLSLQGADYRRILARRLVQTALSYTNIGQGTIGWNLIAHAQAQTNGDLGITQGVTADAITRIRNYEIGENIGDLLTNLSQVINGPRFEITPELVFESYEPGAFPQQSQPVILGVTARSLTRISGASQFANAVLAFGDSEATTPELAEASDLADDTRGRWDTSASYNTVIQQGTLQEAAEGLLDDRVSPAASWTVEIEPTRWETDFPVRPWDEATLVKPATTPTNDPDSPVSATTRTVTPSGNRTLTSGIDRTTTEVVSVPVIIQAESVAVQCVDLQVGFTADGQTTITTSLIEVPT